MWPFEAHWGQNLPKMLVYSFLHFMTWNLLHADVCPPAFPFPAHMVKCGLSTLSSYFKAATRWLLDFPPAPSLWRFRTYLVLSAPQTTHCRWMKIQHALLLCSTFSVCCVLLSSRFRFQPGPGTRDRASDHCFPSETSGSFSWRRLIHLVLKPFFVSVGHFYISPLSAKQ